MTYNDNKALINELWQSFTPSDELRDLFRDTFQNLDQDLFRSAIRNVRRDTDTAWPSVKSLRDEYRRLTHHKILAVKTSSAKYERVVVSQVDADIERVTVEGLEKLIDNCSDDEFYRLESSILDEYDLHRISSCVAYRLGRRLRARVFGEQPGMSRVTKEGALVPIDPPVTF